MRKWLLAAFTLIFGFPSGECIQHGIDSRSWPSESIRPEAWFNDLVSHPWVVLNAYWELFTAQSPTFPNGGWSLGPMLVFTPLFLVILSYFAPKPPAAKRDAMGTFGSARFASDAERAAMTLGLELGIDPETGRAVRMAVQGTLATIAPPRTGKTTGLLIPNLSYPELGAWAGPAVVLDSKGEVFRATRERRQRLGRRVVCLDPLDLVGGWDTWNPLTTLDRTDILYMQKTEM